MAAVDPQGAQKYWIPMGGSYPTVARTGIEPGSQKWWIGNPGTSSDGAFSLDGLIGSAPVPPAASTFPALTVAG